MNQKRKKKNESEKETKNPEVGWSQERWKIIPRHKQEYVWIKKPNM